MFTEHALKRLKERGLCRYYDSIKRVVEKAEPILNRKTLLMRINGVSVVAVNVDEPRVIIVWK